MYCTYCGSKLKKNYKFCSNCGEPVPKNFDIENDGNKNVEESITDTSGIKKRSTKNNNITTSKNFIKQVAKYFMDFLETDFHKRRIPKRSIKLSDKDNLLIGMNLSKYSKYLRRIFRVINNGFDINNSLDIKKGVNKTDIPRNLIKLIELQIKKISQDTIDAIIKKICEEIQTTIAICGKSYGKAANKINIRSKKIIQKELVVPLTITLEETIEDSGLGHEGHIYNMEEELTDVLHGLIEDKISEVFNLMISESDVDILEELKASFEIEDIKTNISSFFNGFKINDLYSEIYEMLRNKTNGGIQLTPVAPTCSMWGYGRISPNT